MRVSFLVAVCLGICSLTSGKVVPNRPSPVKPATTPATAPTAAEQSFTTLEQGYKDAARHQRPLLVIYGAQWCAPCRMLHKELERPEVKPKLTGWTLVHLDVDHPEPGAPAFQGAIPALHLLTPLGKPITSRVGYLSGEELIRWLGESAPKSVVADPDLAGAGPPDAAAISRLIDKLSGADASAREGAIRRLAPFPELAAKPVADAFANPKAKLRTRLAGLDLLQEWKAPVAGIDPWQPETIGAGRLEAIRKWAASVKPAATQSASTSVATMDGAAQDIAALLRAADPADAMVISTRLARLGPALLPQVTQRLKDAATDRDRERLTALRYRLVASPALALGWPGGIERLASADAPTRHAAAEELSKRARAGEKLLLLELFSDPDPLVREISLHGLQAVGGKEGTDALVKLLHDPVPNVRAAVLKQLGESPKGQIVGAVVDYIATETDTDLLVHAVRVLRAAKSLPAVNCLLKLLGHESWRVRAEAIDSLADISQSRDDDGDKPALPTDEMAAAVTKLLADPDGFVAGRALAALKPLARGPSAEAMNEAVKHHPELAFEVVKLLASENTSPATQRTLKKFCADLRPGLRAAALAALARSAPTECEAEIKAALADKDGDVRTAGAQALFVVLEADLTSSNGRRNNVAIDWLERFHARPAWYSACLKDLQALLKSTEQPQRVAAAFPLVALGHEAEALPVALEAAKNDASIREAATHLLPWLAWEKRLALFKSLLAMETSDALIADLVEQMSVIGDPHVPDIIWGLLAGANAEAAIPAAHEAIKTFYGVGNNSGDVGNPREVPKPLKAATDAQFEHGNDNQRVVALAVLEQSFPSAAMEQAKKLYDSPKTSAAMRLDAFQIILKTQPAEAGQRTAAAALTSADSGIRQLALRFLARGGEAIRYLHGSIWMSYTSSYSYSSGEPVAIKPPAGVKAEPLEPFLKSTDPEDAACAGYLLCVLGKKQGLPPLLAYWESQKHDRWNNATALLYRAIATLDDDSQTPILEQIYKSFAKSQYEAKQFYWIIRVMHGPNILKLRKAIRDEIGMQQLE